MEGRRVRISAKGLEHSPPSRNGCYVSFIMPAYQAEETLREAVELVREAAPPRSELIIVDDGSLDGTPELADELADVVVHRPCQGGAARARNDAARVARGEILFFVDSDVTVNPTAVRGALQHLDSGADAFFGAYTALPPPDVANIPTSYKNILHHYTHVHGAGEATTFWSGFGAVKRHAFVDVGGFDPAVTTSADVEDIHLGYRLHAAGYRTVLDPSLQVQHRKHYTLRGLIQSDVMHRAIPWTRAMLELRTFNSDLNLRRHAMLAALVSFAVPLALLGSWWLGSLAAGLSALLLGTWVWLHLDFLRYVRRNWSLGGAVASAGLLYLYYFYGVVGAMLGVVAYVLRHDRQSALNRLHLEEDRQRPELLVSVAIIAAHPQHVTAFEGLPPPEDWWELIVVGPETPPQLPDHARFLPVGPGATRHTMRQLALESSRGSMFASLDEHCIPDDGWLERVREAAVGPALAVAGPFHHDRRTVRSRANQVVRYWQWRPERPPSWVVDHPSANVAYRTDVAMQLGGFRVEGALVLRLAGFGARPVRFDPRMGVCLTDETSIRMLIRGVAGVARLRAAASARYFDIGILHRLWLVVSSPIAGALSLLRVVRQAIRERSADRRFWFALPVTALGLASHWLGRDLGLLRPRFRGGILPQAVEDLTELESEVPQRR